LSRFVFNKVDDLLATYVADIINQRESSAATSAPWTGRPPVRNSAEYQPADEEAEADGQRREKEDGGNCRDLKRPHVDTRTHYCLLLENTNSCIIRTAAVLRAATAKPTEIEGEWGLARIELTDELGIAVGIVELCNLR
jgi:hypothetical protein